MSFAISRLSTARRFVGLPVRSALVTLGGRQQNFATTTKSSEDEKIPTLKRAELIDTVATAHGLSKVEAKAVLETILKTISESLVEGKAVPLTDFGTFTTYVSSARKGRNPNSGETLDIPAKRRVKFKAYTSLKTAVEAKTV